MEESGRIRSTVARRLSTLASFYKYCEQEQLVERNPALKPAEGGLRIPNAWTRNALSSLGSRPSVSPHGLRHVFITCALDAGLPFETCRRPPAC
jgi:site-specific recombinase XerD